jgi:hypothetical protein
VTVDTVIRLDNSHTNLERLTRSMREHLHQIQNRNSNAADGASSTGAADSCETGIFLSGIQDFRAIFDMRSTADPVVVVGRLMSEIGSYGVVSCIIVADRAVQKKEDRYIANAVILYLNTLFHKRHAIVELKKFLQQNLRLKATVSDVFPADETPRLLPSIDLLLRRDRTKARQDPCNK